MTDGTLVRIGSRASALARVQAEWVAERVPGCMALVWVRSEGDTDRTTPLDRFGATGVFTRALDEALHADRVDVAVHSLKDLPTTVDPGLRLACVPPREDVRDALVSAEGLALESLPAGARVGTGSPRRAAHLRHARPDLEVVPVRGNVPTRIAMTEDGRLDAVVLAMAGLRRLARVDARVVPLDTEVMVPAAAQGALGLVVREDDTAAFDALAALRHVASAACVEAERATLRALGAGCHAPVGAHAVLQEGTLRLHVRAFDPGGDGMLEVRTEGTLVEATGVGERAAADLLDRGARPWMQGA